MRSTIVAIMLLLTGCASEKPIELAYSCPVITLPKNPKWYTKNITDNSTIKEVALAYDRDLQQCRGLLAIDRQLVKNSR
jgi:uncharacterized lipoprotein YmbA